MPPFVPVMYCTMQLIGLHEKSELAVSVIGLLHVVDNLSAFTT